MSINVKVRVLKRPNKMKEAVMPEEEAKKAAEKGDVRILGESEENSVPSLEDFTVPELKDMLREQDLKVSGTKDELIERLESNQ